MHGMDQAPAGHGQAEAFVEQCRDAAEREPTLFIEDDGEGDGLRAQLHRGSAERIGGLQPRHLALLFQPLVLASQSVPLDFRPAHIVAEPLMLTAQIVEVLLRVTRRRRILWVPRHAPVMPDSRAPYKSKLLGVSVPRCVVDGEERISRALTR